MMQRMTVASLLAMTVLLVEETVLVPATLQMLVPATLQMLWLTVATLKGP